MFYIFCHQNNTNKFSYSTELSINISFLPIQWIKQINILILKPIDTFKTPMTLETGFDFLFCSIF